MLAVLVLVHEWGHYIVAKKSDIRVDEFGIGFPPRAKKIFKKGDTWFTLNWLPFGGFVKIYGENSMDVEIDDPDKNRSFIAKSKWTQAAVLFAGPFMNLAFAFLVLWIAFFVGVPMVYDAELDANFKETSIVVTEVFEGSPAENVGLEAGDSILEIGICCDETFVVEKPEDVSDFVSVSNDDELQLKVLRGEEVLNISVMPEMNVVEDVETALIGFSMERIGVAKFGIFESFWRGLQRTGQMIDDVVSFLVDLVRGAFTGEADLSGVTGPVGIAGVVGDALEIGFSFLLIITALISINLAIINLLPFPALDGGRLLFILIEVVTGRPIKPKLVSVINTVGFLILISLMVLVTYKDIVNL